MSELLSSSQVIVHTNTHKKGTQPKLIPFVKLSFLGGKKTDAAKINSLCKTSLLGGIICSLAVNSKTNPWISLNFQGKSVHAPIVTDQIFQVALPLMTILRPP